MKSRSLIVGVFVLALIGVALLLQAFSGSLQACPTSIDREVLYQVSTIDSLMAGNYEGMIPLRELRQHGDFGIGTFDALDGEMVALDGVYYQVKADGKAYVPDDATGIPMAAVTFFDSDMAVPIVDGSNFTAFSATLDENLPNNATFYAIKMNGEFPYMKVRSEEAQEKPYPRLVEALKATQKVYELWNTTGTIVGWYSPQDVGGLNVPGYHLHYITEDRSAGGHVLDFISAEGLAELDLTPEVHILMPENAGQSGGNFTEDLEKVEK